MRTSSIYGVSVPELGDRADITVVSDAIISNENNQSGKVENMKATLNSTIIELTSECRTNKLLKYYNGLSIQFVSPVDISAGNSYNIKIDNLAEQPYNNKIDIKLGDVVVAIYGESGFVSYGTTLPRSSSVESDSEVSIANSKAVKTAYDKGVEALDKANTKLDAGSVSTEYNTAEKIEDKIKSSIELANTKLDKGSEDLKLSNAELIVKAIESTQGLKFDTILNIDDVGTKKEGYCYMFEGDIYKCIKQTEATTPESVNFQPISNNKLCDRLDNLFNIYEYTGDGTREREIDFGISSNRKIEFAIICSPTYPGNNIVPTSDTKMFMHFTVTTGYIKNRNNNCYFTNNNTLVVDTQTETTNSDIWVPRFNFKGGKWYVITFFKV